MILFRVRYGEPKLNGEAMPSGGVELGTGLLLEGEKSLEIENQLAVAVRMTVGDMADGGSQSEIPAGATVTVTGPLPVKLEGIHAE